MCIEYTKMFSTMVKQVVSPYAEIMLRAGVQQKDIAELLGYSQMQVSRWFTGKNTPRLSLEEWDKLAALLQTTIDKLPRSFSPQPIHRTQPDHDSP
jgi:predicted transcriptional regulator